MYHIYRESSYYFPESLTIDEAGDSVELEFRDDVLTIRTYASNKLDYTERFKVQSSPLKDLETFVKQNITYLQALEEVNKLKLSFTRDTEICFHNMKEYHGFRDRFHFCTFCGIRKPYEI